MDSKTETVSDNELIARFMGGVFYGPDDLDHPNKWWFNNQPHEGYRNDAHHLTSGLKYDSDWSWIMPVVEKIDSLGYLITIRPTRMIIETVLAGRIIESIHPGYSMLDVVYQGVVEFIKYFNSQSPDTIK